ncbi:hypothetical protein P3W85_26280 [Cupriavidus basilensis]|uniref:Uncharacterized protein n=1 Tax=Cupriavidus basilensis TaxID=68895 RepID=A0ABT6AUX8_9BURK|nr:hypothetical protein [Cupriavidus basilensis]MDF3836432.1 hypothetical protein [Cupriavidus basilensis]
MLTRLPPTRELLDALRRKPPAAPDTAGSDPAATKLKRLQRGLLGLFWACSLAALLVTGAVLFARYQYRHAPAPWLPRLVYSLLAGSVAGLAALLLSHLPALARRVRDPLAPLAERIDRHDEAESALLRTLTRIPAPALRARARRVDLHLRMWEGMAKMLALMIAVSPFALMLVAGQLELPRKGASLVPLLSLYGVSFVAGGALAVFLQLQVSRPLRRLACVLAEAAEISTQLGRASMPAASAAPAATAGAVANARAVPSPAPVPPEVRLHAAPPAGATAAAEGTEKTIAGDADRGPFPPSQATR